MHCFHSTRSSIILKCNARKLRDATETLQKHAIQCNSRQGCVSEPRDSMRFGTRLCSEHIIRNFIGKTNTRKRMLKHKNMIENSSRRHLLTNRPKYYVPESPSTTYPSAENSYAISTLCLPPQTLLTKMSIQLKATKYLKMKRRSKHPL